MRIEFQNFRCLRDTSLELTPLTVIVGPNASGKSSILEALRPDYEVSEADAWQRRPKTTVAIRRISDDGRRSVSELTGPSHTGEASFAYAFQSVRLDVGALRRSNQVVQSHKLATTGENLTNVFDTLDRGTQSELVKQFCDLVPVFSDVNAKPTVGGHKHLVFKDRWSSTAEYTPEQVSDGSMLAFAFLTLRFQKHAPDVLAIEELERGLHPYLIRELVTFLRRMSVGSFGGKQVRVVIATHSPEVLSCLQPHELRMLRRDGEGAVEIVALKDEQQFRQALEEYEGSLGGLWLSGSLGGVPGPI